MTVSAVEASQKTNPPLPPPIPSPSPATEFTSALESALAGTSLSHPYIHRVQRGDTLSDIVLQHLRGQGRAPSQAELYATVGEVALANAIADPDVIFPGQEIAFAAPPAAAIVKAPAGPVRAAPADTARERLVRATIPPQPPLGGPKHSPQTFASVRLEAFRQAATELSEIISRPIRYARGAESLLRFLPGPGARNQAAAVAAISAAEPAPAEIADKLDALQSPWKAILAEPARLTSEFGPRKDPFDGSNTNHDGIDLAATRGSKIHPYKPGTVEFSGWMPGYGNVVVVRHDDGLETIYAHNAKNLVRRGQIVTEADEIGTVGSTGRSTGPHLHFEIRHGGRAVDPVPFMTKEQD